MLKTKLNGVIGLAVIAVVAGCASKPEVSSLPEWVSMPAKQAQVGALATTECVQDNAGMSILKSKATALARADIAKQIQTKVQSLDKVYQSLSENGGVSGSGSTFESVTKQVTDQMLQGAIPEKVEYITIREDERQLCVMVVLSPEKNKKIFDSLLQASDRQLSPDNEALMYQEWRAKKAQEELESTLNKRN